MGHVHEWGILDIASPRRVRDCWSPNRTEPHHVYPESGWTTFRVEGGDDVAGALWLLRLSYLRHARALQTTETGREALSDLHVDSELTELDPSDELRALL
ncbi:luciferase domain-containing protein [Haladaptatus sp. NG-WS-4]